MALRESECKLRSRWGKWSGGRWRGGGRKNSDRRGNHSNYRAFLSCHHRDPPPVQAVVARSREALVRDCV